jgi:hypothetical protein
MRATTPARGCTRRPMHLLGHEECLLAGDVSGTSECATTGEIQRCDLSRIVPRCETALKRGYAHSHGSQLTTALSAIVNAVHGLRPPPKIQLLA